MMRRRTTDELVREGQQRESTTRTPITVVVDNVRSLDNVGMLFRLCELALVDHLYLAGYTGYPEVAGDTRPAVVRERHTRRIEKTAVYALPYQPWTHVADPVLTVKGLKEDGNMVVALEQTDQSVSYLELHDAPPHAGPRRGGASCKLPVTLIVGHEREGVRQELLELADVTVEIPILGVGNSHNVATATGIVLYRILEVTGKI